ncbi:MAG: hypothetical protein RL616_323 [Verrucomicrobiota bacterium]
MNPVKNSERNWMPLAVSVFAAWIITALLTDFVLYADGAHEFIKVLEKQDFMSLWWSRHFSYWIYEIPLVLAIKLGVTDLSWLRFAYGVGCFLPWPLALTICWRISPKNFWLAAAGCAAGYLNGAYMPVGQHCVTHAMFWPALFVLLFAQPIKFGSALILLAMATGLQFGYESQTFFSIPLFGLALWRAYQEKIANRRLAWLYFLVVAVLFLSSVLNGVFSLLMPEAPANLQGFKKGTLAMLTNPGWTVGLTMLLGLLAVLACASEKIWRATTSLGGFGFTVIGILIWGGWPVLASNQLDTGVQYDHRSMNLFVPMALLPLGWVLAFRPDWLTPYVARLKSLVAVLLLAQSLWHFSCACLWYSDTVSMRQVLTTKQGVYPVHGTVMAAHGMLGRDLHADAIGGRFDWSWPCLSIALSPKHDVGCLICSEIFLDPVMRQRCWQPFDPFQPTTLPKLERYGINYSNYTAKLQQQLTPN